jgi:hypothetical protein
MSHENGEQTGEGTNRDLPLGSWMIPEIAAKIYEA